MRTTVFDAETGVFVEREMTPEEVAAWESEHAANRPPTPVVPPSRPALYAAVAIGVEAGAITLIEQAAQFGQIMYEDGWLMAIFSDGAGTASYLIFAQTDIPARVEQFRSEGSFELVFSDPATGDPVEPNRIDIQILKVR